MADAPSPAALVQLRDLHIHVEVPEEDKGPA
jgi:hypothetical protein